jgi:regulator of protease activity HflC (stomatin/prohibitin superfamily)
MAYAKIKEVTTEFQELDFYLQREKINLKITKELSTLFLNQSARVLNVTEVQLRKIELDADLESAVEDKLIELQSQRKWQIQQNITLVVKETELIRQWASNNITLIYANASAQARNIMMIAESNATKIEYEGYGQAFNILSQNVDMKTDSTLLSFMFAESLSKFNKKTNLNIGFKSPATLIKPQSSGGV